MEPKFKSEVVEKIGASADKVWGALTQPQLVKKYFFGVDLSANWEVGGEIVYKGEWEGKSFEDKGKVLEIEPRKRMVINYWSAFSGLPDSLENYQKITYELKEEGGETELKIVQEGLPSEEARKHTEENWKGVLTSIKKMLEG